MNKYQEALNKIVKSSCPNCIDNNGCSSCDIQKICNCHDKSWVNTLQKLVNLQNPKKINYEYDGYADGYPVYDIAYCPNCGRYFDVDGEHFKNCPDCTQALDWSMEYCEVEDD